MVSPPRLRRRLYAHLYTCDALCHLNRSSEALEHLAAAMQLGELSSVASCSGGDASASDGDLDSIRNPYSPVWSPTAGTSKPPGAIAARAILYTNLATVHVLQVNFLLSA